MPRGYMPVYYSLLLYVDAVTYLLIYAPNTLRQRRNWHFADDNFKRIFFNENVRISINNSLKFVPKGPINNIPALVQIMAWRRPGDKPLSEPMVVSLLTHICVTRPQWVNLILINSSPPGQMDAISQTTFLNAFSWNQNENVWSLIKISLTFLPKGQMDSDKIPVLAQIMVWRPTGDKPLSEHDGLCCWRIYASLIHVLICQ